MKKLLLLLLVAALLLPILPAKAESVAAKPYYGIGSSDFNRIKFPNLEGRLTVNVGVEDGEVYFSASGAGRDITKIANLMKSALDRYPEGMRTIVLHNISSVFQLQKDTIYFEEGVQKLKAVFSEFIKTYAQLGGKLDGIVLDVEYVDTHSWYLYSRQYTKENKDVYKNIVANPLYQTTVRPLLAERGFKFYEDASKPEIWSAYPKLKGAEAEEYAFCQTIWDTVMRIRLNNYMTEAVYGPLAQYMPEVPVYDYQSRNSYAWLKDLSDKGAHNYKAGNSVSVGITSHHNTYGSRLSDDFFAADGQPVYNTPVAYNGAEFAATPFNRILWDVNLMKNMYQAADGNVAITVAEYDYSPNKAGTPSNTPYYTESIFHIGLLDPEPFCIYMYDKEFTTQEYNARAQVLQEIMEELTRVAGYADREPILVPSTWNSSFLLSGIYANGRNLWRLTPDTTQVSLEDFKTGDTDPTFTVNGQTITFPQGRIIADGNISVVGTCGYWIETPKAVTPIITNDADRYSQYPSFAEDFEDYADGTVFHNANAKPLLCWQVSGDAPVVKDGALALTGTAALDNVKLPANITAGDYYAKQQAWEISVTFSETLGSGSMQFLMTTADSGFTVEDGKIWYAEAASRRELSGITLQAGETYTFKRVLDLAAFTCSYWVYAGETLLGKAENVPMNPVALPINTVSFSCYDLTAQVLLDDYKLYPTGIATDFEVYDASSGMQQKDITQKSGENVAYRLSWLNGSDVSADASVVATFYDAAGNQLSRQTVGSVSMSPGYDGVETGIVEVPQGQLVVLSLQTDGEAPAPTAPTGPAAKPTAAPTQGQADKPTQGQTTKPTQGQTTKPTQGQATNPTQEQTAKPTQEQTAKPTQEQTAKPTQSQTANPTQTQTAKPAATQPVKPTGQQIGRPTQTDAPVSEPTASAQATVTVSTGEGVSIPATDSGESMQTQPTPAPTQTQAATGIAQPSGDTTPTKAFVGAEPEQKPQEPQNEKGRSHTALWIALGAAILGGAGTAVYLLYRKKKKTDT